MWPVAVLSASQAETARSRLYEETSALGHRDFRQSDFLYYKAHLVSNTIFSLACHPAVVGAAKEALGSDDLLLWDSSVPIKPPAADKAAVFPWHQDATYWGLEPEDGAVSCWVALSNCSAQHGCMRMLPGSHIAGQQAHSIAPGTDGRGSMLRRGQQVDCVDESTAVSTALTAGQMSVHHPLTLHCSGPNTTTEDRVGVVLVFTRPSTRPTNGAGSATLIAGQCDANHWTLSSFRPTSDLGVRDERARRAHAEALAIHRGDLQAVIKTD